MAILDSKRVEESTRVEKKTNGSSRENKMKGLRFQRIYTKPGQDVFATLEWESRDAVIAGDKGDVVFEQREVEFPKSWSQLATNVVASKYFRGTLGTPQR